MNEFDVLLIGYAVGATLALLFLLGTRHTTQPPTVVIQQALVARDSFGCGAIVLCALIAVVAVAFIGAFGD